MDEYISREETVKKIEEKLKVDDLMSLAEEVWTNNCLEIVLRAIMAVETADVQPVNRWISVKDRLPDDCVEVLAYDTDCGVVIGWYDKEIGDFAADFISPLDAVTHWRPLPEKPQD